MTVALIAFSVLRRKNKDMWYAASLYFESVHNPPELGEPIWEHRVILLDAVDDATASQRASEYGKEAEHTYLNEAGTNVTWKFDSVDRVNRIDAKESAPGLEVYSRFLKSSEVAALKRPFTD